MNKIGVSFSINVSQIEKERLYAGKKGKYLDCTVFIDPTADQYGQHGMITQSVSKEEKAQGVKGPILGNAKIFWSENGMPQQQQQPQQQQPQQPGDDFVGDEIPF
jgi:hypothetical protein